MIKEAKRVIVLDLVGLTPANLQDKELTPNLNKIASRGVAAKIKPPFPPVTGTVQATLTTGRYPEGHGIVGNGCYRRDQRQAVMWDQNASPVCGERIWDLLKLHDPRAKTAVLFWQHIKYATADIVITPSPLHSERGMEEWYFSKPAGLYGQLAARQGPFQLHNFWGPLASFSSSQWIARAALETVNLYDPDLTMAYLPNLDYNAQKFGPDSDEAKQSVKQIDSLIGWFVEELDHAGKGEDTALVLLSEYAIRPVSRLVYINRILRDHKWLEVNRIGGKEYIDFYRSKAFAVVDHQVAHVYVQEKDIIHQVARVLQETDGIEQVLGITGKRRWRVNHPSSGELVAVSKKDAWFPYYWWYEDSAAPHYARTVDIHNKPGYDPVELFLDPETRSIPLRPDLVRGSHGSFPTGNDDLVSLIATGPSTGLLANEEVWEAGDIPFLILDLLGYST